VNIAYVVHSGKFNSVLAAMLTSLDRHCNCGLIFSAHQLTDELKQQIQSAFGQSIVFRAIPDEDWIGQRMARKIWDLQSISFKLGDKVFVLDTDLLIQSNIFDGIDGRFDVGITSRHYEYWYKINGGVWGFEYNERSRRFLDFFAQQIRAPDWQPLIKFREAFGRRAAVPHKKLDWWCDQDFLCTVYENQLPFRCTVRDLGSSYNFCPSVEEDIPGTFESARKEILMALGDSRIKVLHFKGRLKEVLAEAMGANPPSEVIHSDYGALA
jgi:hypothetical protein